MKFNLHLNMSDFIWQFLVVIKCFFVFLFAIFQKVGKKINVNAFENDVPYGGKLLIWSVIP